MNCRRIRRALIFVGALGLTTICVAQTGEKLDQLIQSSHIIFMGRVVKLGATNVEGLRAGGNTALVRVEELLDSPAGVAGLKGQDVTVQLLRSESMRTGQQAVFFTNGVLFGQHLAVKEVGQLRPPTDLAQLKLQIAGVHAGIAKQALRTRLESSDLVITGQVIAVKDVERPGAMTEHQADWALAIVQIQAIEKGSLDGKTVEIFFPQSTDERWLLSPKFHVGQTGVWLLHREAKFGLPEGALTALGSLDHQPLGEEENIRALLK